MAKTKQKPAGRERLPKMPGGQAWSEEDHRVWKTICSLSVAKLRSWALVAHKDALDLHVNLTEIRRLRAEEAEFYKRELAVVKRENLGRIQSNLLQTLQSMMATMEGNSRAVHALAVPVGDLLEQLGKELREGKGQQK